MAGRRVVSEWNPATGQKRTWHETLDHNGMIRQVRPDVKFTGGSKVHYHLIVVEIIWESGEKMSQPTIEEIVKKLNMIFEGKLSREEVSDWASEYVMQDEPCIEDETVWEFLQVVSGVDIKDSPEEYLHVEQDLEDWIKKYSSKCKDTTQIRVEWNQWS